MQAVIASREANFFMMLFRVWSLRSSSSRPVGEPCDAAFRDSNSAVQKWLRVDAKLFSHRLLTHGLAGVTSTSSNCMGTMLKGAPQRLTLPFVGAVVLVVVTEGASGLGCPSSHARPSTVQLPAVALGATRSSTQNHASDFHAKSAFATCASSSHNLHRLVRWRHTETESTGAAQAPHRSAGNCGVC